MIIVDDHPLVRDGLRDHFGKGGHFLVLATAGSAQPAVHLCREHRPDVLLMDVEMPGRDALGAIPDLRAASPGGGAGTRMLREMLRLLQTDPPYATVFGFTRTPNVEARGFYAASGFTTFTVPGVYADGTAVLFTAPYKYLLGYHSITKE
jgi:CheY-like chemotaxis protein